MAWPPLLPTIAHLVTLFPSASAQSQFSVSQRIIVVALDETALSALKQKALAAVSE